MRTDPRHLPVVQNDDLICILDGCGSLRDDKYCRLLLHPPDRTAQRRVRSQIQSGSAVVQYQDLRPAHKRPGNGKPLLLSAGQISPALLNLKFQFSRFSFYEFL